MAAIGAGCGILILFNPFKTSLMVFKIIGIFIIIYSILDIISIYQIKKTFKQSEATTRKIDNATIDAEVIIEQDTTEQTENKSKKKNTKSKKEKNKNDRFNAWTDKFTSNGVVASFLTLGLFLAVCMAINHFANK